MSFSTILGVILVLFSVHDIRGEVSGGNPAAQSVKDGSTQVPNEQITKYANEFSNLTVNVLNVPSVRQAETVFRELCEKSGGNQSYEQAMKAISDIRQCFSEIISFAQLPSKIEAARPNGDLDTVFAEYCQKTDQIKSCLNMFLLQIDPCLPDGQKHSKYTVQNISEAILRFVCENEGDHIALFISEKGPDCILSKQEGIKKCLNEKMPNNESDSVFNEINSTDSRNFNYSSDQEELFSLQFELTHCRTAFQIRKCIVKELTSCSGSTPANVVDSIFNLIHHSTQCSKFPMKEIDPDYNAGSSIFTSMFAVIIPALTVLLVRTFNS